jgi:UDP-N-acetylmuramoyl-L-alanyl-D-glutamate--2,6-diaminopimelate ligase
MAQISLFSEVEIASLCFDSRKATSGSVFFAIPGTQVDGHAFLTQVYEQGCKLWVVEKQPAEVPSDVQCVQVEDSNELLLNFMITRLRS